MGGKGKGPSAFVRVRHREWGGPGAARGLSHERIPDVKLCPLGVSQQKSVTHMLGARVAGADKWAVPDTLSASCFLGDSRPEAGLGLSASLTAVGTEGALQSGRQIDSIQKPAVVAAVEAPLSVHIRTTECRPSC